MNGWRRLALLMAPLAACIALSGCVAPAFDAGAYQQDAVSALESAVSSTRTADVALRGRLDDRLPAAYADTVVTESEKSLDPIEGSFGVVDPPTPALDTLRAAVLKQLGDSADALSQARIAVRRQDAEGMAAAARKLRDVADQMERKAENLS